MAKKQYKTARGSKFDMERFTQQNADSVALGNLGGNRPVNAKGDILGSGGKIAVKRDTVVRQHYREEIPSSKMQPLSMPIKTEEESFITPEEAIQQLIDGPMLEIKEEVVEETKVEEKKGTKTRGKSK